MHLTPALCWTAFLATIVLSCGCAGLPFFSSHPQGTPTPAPEGTPGVSALAPELPEGIAFDVYSYGNTLAVHLGANRVAVSADGGGSWTLAATASAGGRRTDFGTDGASLYAVHLDQTSSAVERLDGGKWVSANAGLPEGRIQFADGEGTLVGIDIEGRVYKRGAGTWTDMQPVGRPAAARDPWLAQVASGSLWVLGSSASGLDTQLYKVDLAATGSAWSAAGPLLENVPDSRLFGFATDGSRASVENITSNITYSLELSALAPAWKSAASVANGSRAAGGHLYRANSTRLERLSDAGTWEDWGQAITCAGSTRIGVTAVAVAGANLYWGTCNGLMKGSATDPATSWTRLNLGS